MKKSILLLVALFFIVLQSQSQVSEIVNAQIEAQAKALCKKFKLEYVGNITSTAAVRSDYSILVEGTVDYKSPDCGNVTADYRGIMRLVATSIEATCFYINMPTCALGIPIYYTKEYSVGGDECK